MEELIAVSRRVTSRDVAIVHKWADLPPPVIWNQLAARLIDGHKVDRWTAVNAYAYMNMAMYDAFVSCWHTKYHYWVARPFQRIPQLVTVVATPHFPTYTSGHAMVSSAAGVVLGAFFPAENAQLRAEAAEAAQSRLLGGIHFRHDNDQGLAVGGRIGEKVVSAARQQGAL
jgi:membrane-associated phospholipid phosphatase